MAGPETAAPQPRRKRDLAVLVGLTVVVIALIGVGTVFGWRLIQAETQEARRAVALQTARQAADHLTTIDYRTADRDVQQLIEGSTEEFATRFGLSAPEFREVVKQTQLVSTGEITSAGIERIDEQSARVLVAVKAVVRDADLPQGAERNYRMGVELVWRADQWLVSDVEFIL